MVLRPVEMLQRGPEGRWRCYSVVLRPVEMLQRGLEAGGDVTTYRPQDHVCNTYTGLKTTL